MERKKGSIRSRRGATISAKRIPSPAKRAIAGTHSEVRNYRCFFRLLPRRIYAAIITAVWETAPTPRFLRAISLA